MPFTSCCRKVSMRGESLAETKTAPSGAVLALPAPGGLLLGEISPAGGRAALDDRHGLDLAALHGEDGHLGVLAVALGVELDLAGGAVVADLRQLGQVLRRIGRV